MTLAAWEAPFTLAVIVAVALIEPLLEAVNWALIAFAGTVIDGGTVSAPLLLARVTVRLLVGALLNVTVQVLAAAPVSDPGLQMRLVTLGGGVLIGVYATVPPDPVTLIPLPEGDAAIAFATVIFAVCVTVTLMIATTPSGISVSFSPYATQV